ncbi:unnamed protein product [Pleuronectes platessa]|uniref:Uncharacterized protein n=1 Tax=Pleuronectes platessa TaxID=8262 RepID=A0A9N7YVV2_PLEPL|nr:unnamed protein product [Pleuronectes platessa]
MSFLNLGTKALRSNNTTHSFWTQTTDSLLPLNCVRPQSGHVRVNDLVDVLSVQERVRAGDRLHHLHHEASDVCLNLQRL